MDDRWLARLLVGRLDAQMGKGLDKNMDDSLEKKRLDDQVIEGCIAGHNAD